MNKKMIYTGILALILLASFTSSPVFGSNVETIKTEDEDTMITTQSNTLTYENRNAVIVVGVYQTQQHYTWYLKAAQNLYNSLTSERYGFTDEEIHVLLVIRDDYDPPEIFNPDIVDAPATIEEIQNVLSRFKTSGDLAHSGSDMLMFTWISHGNIDYFGLEGGEGITPDELNSYSSNIAGRIIFVLQPCMSGSFLPELSGQNRIVCTSVGPISMEGGWIETFTRAMNGDGDYRPADGRISFEEMFYHAADHVSEEFKFSRLDDNYDSVGHGPFWLGGVGYDIDDPEKDGYLSSRVYDLRYEENPIYVTIVGPTSAKPDTDVELSATVSGVTEFYTYSWDFDASDGIQEDSTESQPTVSYSEKKQYTITLTITDSTERTGTDTHLLTIGKGKVKQMHFLSILNLLPSLQEIVKLLLKF